LSKDTNLYKRLETMLSIIVRDIVNKKIINKRMYLFIYVVDIDEVVLQARSYVTKSIKVDVILGNDVLELLQNRINLYLYSKQMQIDRI